MSDVGGFEVMVQGLQTATTIAKELLGLNLSRNVSAKFIEMNAVILTAQSSALTAQAREMELADRVRKLEEEVVQLKDWDVEKEDYELKSIEGTSFAYMIKESVQTSEPKHWLCQRCFENAKKSALQRKEHPATGRGRFWACNTCSTDILVMEGAPPGRMK